MQVSIRSNCNLRSSKKGNSVRQFLLVAFVCTWLYSCYSLPHSWYYQDEFIAHKNSYFPDFIVEFFPHAIRFEKKFNSVALAAQGFKLIEIKPLIPRQRKNSEANLAWSKNGRFLSYEKNTPQGNLIEIRELSGRYHQTLSTNKSTPKLAPWLQVHYKSYNSGLSWSQDEQKFAFISNGVRGSYNVFVGELDTVPYAVTQSRQRNGFAKWSPQSQEIAYISSATGHGDIYTFDLQSESHSLVWASPDMELFPEWIPHGDGIVFNSGKSNQHQIMAIIKDASGEWDSPYYLTQWPNDNLRPTLSPDGQWVAFFGSNERDGWDLYVLPFSGRYPTAFDMKKHIIAHNVVLDLNTGPAWSPSGEYIFFIANDLSLFNPIYAHHLKTGIQYRLQTNTRMNRDLMISKHGVLSFRAQVGAWDKIFVALTNLGISLNKPQTLKNISYYDPQNPTYIANYITQEAL